MSTSANGLPELERALRTRSFTFVGRNSEGWPHFKGSLTAAGATHVAWVSVDLTGQQLPHVAVQMPANAPAVMAHVSASGSVCYASKGTLVLDIFNMPGQTLACLDRAANVLDLALQGKMQQDLEDEFFVCWNGDLCLLDVDAKGREPLSVLHFDHKGLAFITNSPERTQKKLSAMGLTGATEMEFVEGFQVTTTAKPRPTQGVWPPPTVADLLRWQSILDLKARREIERQLLSASVRRKQIAVCVVKSPLTQYAFWVPLGPSPDESPAQALKNARRRLYAAKVHPMSDCRIDDNYVTSRNTPAQRTLAGKRIALIGCGTIGGFLAELLVKAGAGIDDGELLLIDPDRLFPQNVGRHRLGLNQALEKKAPALKEELLRGAPTANIKALPAKVEEVKLDGVDLLVDATGEEALGYQLTRIQADAGKFIPTLSVWVEGPGVAVRALMRSAVTEGCTRCLCGGHGEQLLPVIEGAMPDELAGHGCESLYVPFPATVSVRAACLAAVMVSDWLNGVVAPRLQTEVVRRGFAKATEDTDVPRRDTCPACSS
jgi:hypothetical protein